MQISQNENVNLSLSSQSIEGEVKYNLNDEIECESANEDL